MNRNSLSAADRQTLRKIKEVRAEALAHVKQARRLAAERRRLMENLIDRGLSQADLARELGVTRQAVQKMLSL